MEHTFGEVLKIITTGYYMLLMVTRSYYSLNSLTIFGGCSVEEYLVSYDLYRYSVNKRQLCDRS